MSAALLQRAVYDALNGDAALNAAIVDIFDNPLQVPNPDDNALFPFLTVGSFTSSPWDTDLDTGFDVVQQVHTWTRDHHMLGCKEIQDLVYNVLHRTVLNLPDYNFLGSDLTFQDATRDADAITIHGVQEFRMVYERI